MSLAFSLFSLVHMFEACRCFCRPSWKLLAVFVGYVGSFSVFVSRLGSFLLFLSAVLEASHHFCQLSQKLLVFVGCLGSFSLFLLAVFEAFCCFSQPFLLFCIWLFLTYLVGCFCRCLVSRSSCCFSRLFLSSLFSFSRPFSSHRQFHFIIFLLSLFPIEALINI